MNIVILSTYFQGNNASANGLCAREIYQALKEKGHNVFVVCNQSGCNKDNNIHEIISENIIKKRSRFIERIHSYMDVIRVDYNKQKFNEYYTELKKICHDNSIDVVVAMYFPLEAILAAVKFKQESNSFKLIGFELDSYGDGIQGDSPVIKWKISTYNRLLQKQYKFIDIIVEMRSHLTYWKKTFPMYESRLRVSDIPMLKLDQYDEMISCHHPKKGIYSGLLDKNYRDPSYLLNLFETYRMVSADFELHFYSKGDCEEQLEELSNKIPSFIFSHGYIAKESLDQEISHCDFLINVGNSNSRSVPSKLISYISTGKPIVHFSKSLEDVCINYLERYPNAIIISENDSEEENMKKLTTLFGGLNKRIDRALITESFKENLPSYSAQIIEAAYDTVAAK